MALIADGFLLLAGFSGVSCAASPHSVDGQSVQRPMLSRGNAGSPNEKAVFVLLHPMLLDVMFFEPRGGCLLEADCAILNVWVWNVADISPFVRAFSS